MVDALVRQLAIHLVRTHLLVRKSDRVEWSRAGPVDRRLRLAVEYVHDHYAESLSLEQIAGAAFLSEYHFARLFKQLMGVTPHSYLTSVRLEQARRRLANTKHSIIEIAGQTGFGSQSHFTRVFRAAFGTTPRAYREAAKGFLSS
jgi:AraC family transcriptional regulator